MFLILFRNILCPQQMFPSLRGPRNIMSNNVSATMCKSCISSDYIYRPSISNNYGATTFSFLASKVWESIPSELKKLSYNRFYKQFKMYLLNTQSVS